MVWEILFVAIDLGNICRLFFLILYPIVLHLELHTISLMVAKNFCQEQRIKIALFRCYRFIFLCVMQESSYMCALTAVIAFLTQSVRICITVFCNCRTVSE